MFLNIRTRDIMPLMRLGRNYGAQLFNLFNILLSQDDIDEQKADSYDVDGGYVPRVYFLGKNNKLIAAN